uniref:Uncharacterized protein n=1 Tax=Arundo donax TaxID=35708 RepID=A0A0A9FWJ1_ARUDO
MHKAMLILVMSTHFPMFATC